VVLFFVLLVLGCEPAVNKQMSLVDSKPLSFYIWQRVWTDGVKQAVRSEVGEVSVLASEFDRQGLTTVGVDWTAFNSLSKVTAVIRVHVNWLDRSDLVSKIVKEFDKYPSEVFGLQLDLDCPTRRLGEYGKLLKLLKAKLPKRVKLSVTALPSHLNSSSFQDLFPSIAYYVLQVHGIEVRMQIDEPVELMNFTVAENAFKRAALIGFPFKIALPTYAYRLFFDKKSGKFIRLSAENSPKIESSYREKIISVDLTKLHGFIIKSRPLCLAYQGVVWFRLPMPQDSLTYARELITQLAAGKQVKLVPKVFVKVHGSRQDLFVENLFDFSRRTVKISIGCKNRLGEWDLVRGFSATEDNLPGQFPKSVVGRLPSPGEPVYIGWFRPLENNKIKVNIECSEK